jgi:choloylglycine hydrolase
MRPLAAALLLLAARPALPCSAFLLEGSAGPVVGKSYDWDDERGLVLVNKRGMAKRALVTSADVPAAWRSRFASLTFNQYGREQPNGGINEAGLVVEVLVLRDTEVEPPDARPAVTELGLVQYLLDQAQTVKEAIALARKVRVATAVAPLHYFVCDPSGACAVLELLGGRLTVTTGADLRVRAITNSRWADSIAALRRGDPATMSSLGRFVRLARRIATPASVPAAEELLGSVRFADSTQWTIVYELRARRVHFWSRRHPAPKTVALGEFPPGCESPAMTFDLASKEAGEVGPKFVPYSDEANRAMVRATLAPYRSSLPAGVAERLAAHPSTLACER